MSKQIDKMIKIHPEIFHGWWIDDGGCGEFTVGTPPSYWVYLHHPYLTHRGVGCIHTKTVKEALKEMKDVVLNDLFAE